MFYLFAGGWAIFVLVLLWFIAREFQDERKVRKAHDAMREELAQMRVIEAKAFSELSINRLPRI